MTMNKDQIRGTAKEVAGKVEQKLGKLIGSNEHRALGLKRQVEGKLQKGIGDLKEAVSELKAAVRK